MNPVSHEASQKIRSQVQVLDTDINGMLEGVHARGAAGEDDGISRVVVRQNQVDMGLLIATVYLHTT